MTSAYLTRPLRTEAQATEEMRLRTRLYEAEGLIADMEAYFDQRADTEDGPDGPELNEEARFMVRIEEFLGKAKGGAA